MKYQKPWSRVSAVYMYTNQLASDQFSNNSSTIIIWKSYEPEAKLKRTSEYVELKIWVEEADKQFQIFKCNAYREMTLEASINDAEICPDDGLWMF